MADPLLDTAKALGLAVAPEWEAAVLTHLRLLLRLGTEVAASVAELPDTLEPLPIDRLSKAQ